MTIPFRLLLACLIISVTPMSLFSQDAGPKGAEQPAIDEMGDSDDESSKSRGLRRIETRSNPYVEIDINIDEEALEHDIELSIENAMESVEVALESIDIRIEPIDINIGDMDIDIPEMHLDVEPFEMDDIDIDIDEDDFYRDDDGEEEILEDELDMPVNQNVNKTKAEDNSGKEKNKSENKNKDKSEGLKKIN